METTTTSRTPTRCREWERQRRNKFNDALTRLGDIVKAIIKSNNTTGKEIEDVQYPKIEIVQKAILCLNNCVLERTQLKAEILALQVELDANKHKKFDRKDASVQVCVKFNKKNKSNKYVKFVMMQKSKCSALKEKTLGTNVIVTKETNDISQTTSTSKIPALPKLLPRITDKKGPENAIVVLPATPYIFPQRPLLFPSVPPAILLVEPNLQTFSKSPVPMIGRNSGDVTKTTMVNILPISAYSLSVTKAKKSGKIKSDNTKKFTKKSKPSKLCEPTKPELVAAINETQQKSEIKNQQNVTDSSNGVISKQRVDVPSEKIEINNINNNLTQSKEILDETTHINDVSAVNENVPNNESIMNSDKTNKILNIPSKSNSSQIKCTESIINVTSVTVTTNVAAKVTDSIKTMIESNTTTNAINKIPEVIADDKGKENKLPTILDASLCDSAVDGGNARLELAEEFLAASPTAAFLMSFPLVSGNRAESPAEEPQNTVLANTKDNHRRNDALPQPVTYFEKTNNSELKTKAASKVQPSTILAHKTSQPQKPIENNVTKEAEATKTVNTAAITNASTENPFLNLPMTSLISTSCTLAENAFGLDFDCNIGKSAIPSQPTTYVSNSNLFYKSDPFSTVKNTIYSTSSISSSHEYNALGLYPCAMEKYTTKNKSDFGNVEDNLMKIGSSRLTYDIDLGWSHKGFDFVNCTTAPNTYSKDILTTASGPYSTAYNPFNPEFHVPLVSSSNKRDNNTTTKTSSSFAESISSFYSQPSNIWTEDAPFYTNNTVAKALTTKHQNYHPVDHVQTNLNLRANSTKHYEAKQIAQTVDNIKHSNIGAVQPSSEKYTKKSPSKMHINWMTSEIRPMQNNCNVINADTKQAHKPAYGHVDITPKKQEHNESNYFPIHNFSTQSTQEEFQVWPSTRPLGTTEISIEPPPINLPTLVGDLALGPHDKKKNADLSRTVPPTDVQNCGNFLSVTQLMNRSTDMSSRYHGPNSEPPKSMQTKQNLIFPHFSNDGNRKNPIPRLESHIPQPCYVFNEPKPINIYDNTAQFAQNKSKVNIKTDKSSKTHKNNNYSAEALIRGGSCTQKIQDSSNKFTMPIQKYNDYAVQDSSVAQVSHFPPILDYSDNSYAGQQFSGTTLYNATTNTISNSFYSNFMPGTSNLMSSNYTSGPFAGDFIDYNQTAECSYTNHKYEELKMRNNPAVFHTDKVPSNYKSTRRESSAKHKLECSKKDTSKKYHNKRAKINNEVEEWNDPSHLLWQNKANNKRHSNLISDELPFPNYVGNQMSSQYQPDIFNSHLMASNVQPVGHNVDRSLSSFPATSRANFNLSTIFPEITMKVQ